MEGLKGRTCGNCDGWAYAAVAALMVVGGLSIPEAGAATIRYSATPLAGWQTNGTVKAVLVVGDTVYVGGQFTQVRGQSGSRPPNRTNLAAFDRATGALRTGFRRTRTATCARSRATEAGCSSAAPSPRSAARPASGSAR